MWEKLLSNISVKSRIKIFFTLLFIFFVAVNVFTIYTIDRIKKNVESINTQFASFQNVFNKINGNLSELVLNTYVYAEEKVSYTDFYNFYVKKQQAIQYSLSQLEKDIKSFESYLLFQKLQSSIVLLDNYSLEILQAYKNQDFSEVKTLYIQQYELYKNVKKNLEELKTVTSTAISRKTKQVREEIRSIIFGLIFFDLAIIFATVIFFLIFFKDFGNFYNKITAVLQGASKGEILELKLPESSSELGRLAVSVNTFLESRRKMAEFIQLLISGQYKGAVMEELSEDDIIAKSLNELADRLREAQEIQKQREEEEKQKRWHTEGMNLFSDIMRSSSDDLQKLGDSVIQNLVKYLDASVGGLFVYNDDDPEDLHLDLLSVFAYDRKKFYTKRVELGEGLVGTAALDKTVIYLTEVPEDYMEIESGLGDAVPNTLLIVPLMTDRGIMGVVEIASFRRFEQFELDFVEDVAKSIAATLEAVKVNARTLKLLEETRQKSEELARNEAELRRTMEQVRIAQERAEEHAAEMTSILNAVSQALLKVEFDAEGKVTSVNDSFLRTLQLTERQVLGEHFRNILPKDNRDLDKVILKKLESYQIYKDTLHYQLGERDVWLLVQFAPIIGKNNELIRVLWLSIDITEQKEIELKNSKLLEESIKKSEELMQAHQVVKRNEVELKSIMQGIDQALLRAEYSVEGILLFANEKHRQTLGYNYEEVLGKSIFIFIPDEEKEDFKKLWDEVASGMLKQIQVKRKTAQGDDIWLLNQYTPVRDEQGNIVKILYLAIDITEQVEAEQRARKLLEESQKIQQELQQKEAELRAIMEGIDQAILRAEYSVDGTLLFANELHRRTFGYNYEEILGKSIFIFIPDDEKEEFQKLWDDVSQGHMRQLRVKRYNAHGEEIWLLNQYAPVRDEEGNVYKIVYLAQDITEQVKAEQEAKEALEKAKRHERQLVNFQEVLRKAEAERRAVVQGIDRAILRAEYSADGILLFANELHRQTFGYDYEELLGKSIFEFIPDEEKEQFEKDWQEIVKGNIKQLRVKRYTASGEEIWLLNQYSPVKDENGEVYKILYLAQDITEQVKAEQEAHKLLEESRKIQQELQQKEAELRAIMEGIDQAILRAEYSVDGALLYANELHRKTFGYNYQEILGKSIFIFIPEQEKEDFEKLWQEVSAGQMRQLRVKRFDANGNEIWLLNQYAPVKDENGKVYKIVYLAQDITEQVKAEQEAKKALTEAIRREKELRDAQKRMASLLKAIDGMLLRVNYTPEGVLKEASEEAFEFFGVTKEMIGRFKIYNFLERSRAKEMQKVWNDVILKGQIYKAEWSFKKDGEIYWFQTSFAPIVGLDGNVVEVVTLNLDITETKQREADLNKALDESLVRELELKGFLQAVDATLLRAEYLPDGTFITSNELHRETLGYELDDMKGKKIFEFIPQEELDEFKQLWEDVKNGNPRQIIVKRYRKDTDEEIWFLNQYTPVFDENGQVARIIYLAINITDQKTLEQELSGALQNIEFLLSGVDKVLLRATYDAEGRLLDSNKLHQETLGYDLEDLKGKKIVEFIPEDEREEFLDVWEKVLNGKPQNVIVKRERKDTGQTLWLLNQYIPITDQSGVITKVLYLATDITEQKELELRLQYFTRGIDSVLLRAEYMPDGTLVDANKLHQKVLGYDIEHYKGKNIIEFVPVAEREDFKEKIWSKVAAGQLLKVIVQRERKDTGEVIWLLNQYIPVKNLDGQVERIVYLATDITEQKLLEEELEELTKAIDKSYLRVDLTKDGIILKTNDLHAKIIGYEPGELNGKNIFDISPEGERGQLKEIWEELKKGNSQQQIVRRVRRDTGEELWLLNSFVPLFDAQGNFDKVIILAIDFTREYTLLEQGERYGNVIETLTEYFIKAALNVDKTIFNRNKLFDSYFGTGDNFDSMLSNGELKDFASAWNTVMNKKPAKFIVQRGDKTLVGQLAPVIDKQGNIEKILYLAIDIKTDNGFKYGGQAPSGGEPNIEFGSEIDKDISKWLDDLSG